MRISDETRKDLGRLITAKEAADRLGLTVGRIRQYITEGRLPALKMVILIDPDDLGRIKLKKRGPKRGRRRLEILDG